MRHISISKEVITASTFKLFNPLRVYWGFPLKHIKIYIILVYWKILTDLSTSPKTYWSVPKSFHNNKKKCISLTFYKNSIASNVKEKAKSFNSFFAKQCSVIDTSSKTPSALHPKTDKSLTNTTFTKEDIENVT